METAYVGATAADRRKKGVLEAGGGGLRKKKAESGGYSRKQTLKAKNRTESPEKAAS